MEFIHHILAKRASNTPDKLAFRFFKEKSECYDSITYKELHLKSLVVSSILNEHLKWKTDKQPRALLLFPSGIDFIASFFACLNIGVIAVPTSRPQNKRSINRLVSIIEDCSPDIILSDKQTYDSFSNKIKTLTPSITWKTIDTQNSKLLNPPIKASINTEVAFIQYSSGSTGKPKGVVISHKNIISNQAMIKQSFGLSANDSIVGWLPLFHDMGLIGNVLHPIYMGIPSTLMSPVAFLQKPIRWLEAISEFKATTSGGPNFAYDLCTRRVDGNAKTRLDLSSWRLAFNGSEKIQPHTLKNFSAAFQTSEFKQNSFFSCYGLAEATLLVTGTTPQVSPRILTVDRTCFELESKIQCPNKNSPSLDFVSVGRPPSGSIFIVSQKTKKTLEIGNEGEIWVSGKHIASEYLNQLQLSKETFHNYIKEETTRYLRTGDLGFIDDQGDLFVSGRLKELIIIRGRNIHPQDIERSITNSFPEFEENGIAAFSLQHEKEEKLVVICEVKRTLINKINKEELELKLSQYISNEFQVELFDCIFIKTNHLPKTSSGKIQRVRARFDYENKKLVPIRPKKISRPIQNETQLQRELRNELNLNILDCTLPLSSYGLDSLKALELQVYFHDKYKVDISYQNILEEISLNQISETIQRQNQNMSPQSSEATTFPLSEQQKRLWFFQQHETNKSTYNILLPLKVSGKLNPSKVKQSVVKLIELHPSLRTTFQQSLESDLIQTIHSPQQPPVYFHQTSSKEETDAKLSDIASREYDLSSLSLFSLEVIIETNSTTLLVFSAHHIICDLWSLGLILKDFIKFYHENELSLDSSHSFAHKVEIETDYQNSKQLKFDLKYWTEKLNNQPINNPLRYDYSPKNKLTFTGDFLTFEIPKSLFERIENFKKNYSVTSLEFFLALYALFLNQESDENNLIIGSTFSGRTTSSDFKTVGFFSNPLPIPIELTSSLSFLELVDQVKKTLREIASHDSLPFSKLSSHLIENKALRFHPGLHPIFSTMLIMQTVPSLTIEENSLIFPNQSDKQISYGDFSLSPYPWKPLVSLYDLSLFITQTKNSYLGMWEYNTNLFDKKTIQFFSSSLISLMDQFTLKPEATLSEPSARINSELTLDQIFKETLICRKNQIAIYDQDKQFTFNFIDQKSDQLASYLYSEGNSEGDIIALHLDYSIELICVIVALFKLGITFVPIDPEMSKKRKDIILSLVDAKLLVTDEVFDTKLKKFVLNSIDSFHHELRSFKRTTTPLSTAYILFTSGSTGIPKGVKVSQASLAEYLYQVKQQYKIVDNPKFAAFTSISFDLSLTSLIYPLLIGGSLELYKRRKDLYSNFDLLLQNNTLTHLKLTPSHLKILSSYEYFPNNLSTLIVGGEQLSYQLTEPVFAHNPHLRIINEYGPTETTIGCIYYEFNLRKIKTGIVPIGRPFPNVSFVIDDNNKLKISGPLLSNGYYKSPGLTAAKFTPIENGSLEYHSGDIVLFDPSDSYNLVYQGRVDREVKIRSHRVDLSEIEKNLQEIPYISQCIVIYKNSILYCYYLLNRKVDKSKLIETAENLLPSFMRPQNYIEYSEFPLTPNGKIDVEALSVEIPKKDLSLKEAQLTKQQEILLNAWKEIFNSNNLTIYDNFFELGGDSIKAIQVIAYLKKFSIGLTIKNLFENPRIIELSSKINQSVEVIEIENVNLEEIPLSPFQNEVSNYNSNIDHFNMGVIITPTELFSKDKIKMAMNTIIGRHPALKSQFYMADNKVLSRIRASESEDFYNFYEYKFENELELNSSLQKLTHQLQGNIKLLNGKLIQICFLEAPELTKLIIVIHHFIIDGVSWRIILNELESLTSESEINLNHLYVEESSSFPNWLTTMYKANFGPSETFWKDYLSNPHLAPKDFTLFDFKNRQYKELKVTPKNLTLLQQLSTSLFKISLHELLLYLFSQSLLKFQGLTSLLIDLESHGRKPISNLDLSETIGWFTAKYPVLILKEKDKSPYANIRSLVNELELIAPHKDFYSFIKQSTFTQASVCFNFLGEFQPHKSFQLEFIRNGNVPQTYKTPYLLEVNCWIHKGSLVFDFNYDKSLNFNSYAPFFKNNLNSLLEFSEHLEKPLVSKNYYLFQELISPEAFIGLVKNFDLHAIESLLPLFPAQYDFLIESIRSTKSQLFYEEVCFEFEGSVNTTYYEKSILTLVNSIEALKARIIYKNAEHPFQLISQKSKKTFYFCDLSNLSKSFQQERIKQEKEVLYNLDQSPLFKVFLFKTSSNSYISYWCFHHIILDGWSLSNLFQQWITTYTSLENGKTNLERSEFNLETYFKWALSKSNKKMRVFWANYLAGFSSKHLLMYTPAPASKLDFRSEISHKIPRGRYENIEKYCSSNNLTLNTVLQFFWGLAVSTFSNDPKVLFASVVSGRPEEIEGIDSAIGLFSNVLPTKFEFNQELSLLDHLSLFQKGEVEKYSQGHLPFSEIVNTSSEIDPSMLTLFVFENYPFSGQAKTLVDCSGLPFSLKKASIEEKTGYSLTISILPSEEPEVFFQYNPDHFSSEYIKEISNFYISLLGNISDIAEYNSIKNYFEPQSDDPIDKEHIEPTPLLERFYKLSKRQPYSIAIIDGSKQLSYQELNHMSDHLAVKLLESGVKSSEVVATSYKRSLELIITYLAILKAGAVYLPIDSSWPNARIQNILNLAKAKALISAEKEPCYGCTHLTVNKDLKKAPAFTLDPIQIHPNSPAYLLFTSGSTGTPKGILVPHSALLNHFLWTKDHFSLSTASRMLQMTSPTFDVSLSEFSILFEGGTLFILPEQEKKDAVLFFKYVEKQQISHIQLVPSFLKVLNEVEKPFDLSSVKHILCGAEAISKQDLESFFSKYNIPFSNIYGLTETCIDSLCQTLDDSSNASPVPIGKPIRNTNCYLLDQNLLAAKPFVPVELYLGGAGLAMGYLDDPKKTAESFLPNPFGAGDRVFTTRDLCYWNSNKQVVLLGRIDSQIKIRGIRVEIHEIEHALCSIEGIKDAAIISTNSSIGQELKAFYTSEYSFDSDELKTLLGSKLPYYMIPSFFLFLERMPLTQSGKIDRKALSQITTFNENLTYTTENSTQDVLQNIYSKILDVKSHLIDPKANFFDLGGNSLGIMQLQTAVNKSFKKQYGIEIFFEKASIKELASFIETKENTFSLSNKINERLEKQQKRRAGRAKCNRPTQ